MAKRSAVRHRLNVVFDTSTLYTKRVDDLVNEAIAGFIKANQAHADIEIFWTVPQMVALERENQMLEAARTHVVALNKIERLLGTNWGVTEDNLALHVDKAIKKRMADLGLQLRPLDNTRVDWQLIAQRAARRLPPFEKGDTEKGFKDAIVAETFLQLAEEWVRADSRNKAIFVAKDGLLKDWVISRIPSGTRYRVLDMSGLQSEINILGSSVDEAFAAELVADAGTLFYLPSDKATLYYMADLSTKIKTQFAERFNYRPNSAVKRIAIGHPVFVEKTSRRVTFSTKIIFSMEAKELVVPPWSARGASGGFFTLGNFEKDEATNSLLAVARAPSSGSGSDIQPTNKLAAVEEVVHTGTIEFIVTWAASLLRSKRLSTPEVISIDLQVDNWSPIDQTNAVGEQPPKSNGT
ncbi:MAG: PIN domain-containing protein [Paraburkholderia fungorum]|nr:PIN domain-containing protein [Paraburkholderia fungorum]